MLLAVHVLESRPKLQFSHVELPQASKEPGFFAVKASAGSQTAFAVEAVAASQVRDSVHQK